MTTEPNPPENTPRNLSDPFVIFSDPREGDRFEFAGEERVISKDSNGAFWVLFAGSKTQRVDWYKRNLRGFLTLTNIRPVPNPAEKPQAAKVLGVLLCKCGHTGSCEYCRAGGMTTPSREDSPKGVPKTVEDVKKAELAMKESDVQLPKRLQNSPYKAIEHLQHILDVRHPECDEFAPAFKRAVRAVLEDMHKPLSLGACGPSEGAEAERPPAVRAAEPRPAYEGVSANDHGYCNKCQSQIGPQGHCRCIPDSDAPGKSDLNAISQFDFSTKMKDFKKPTDEQLRRTYVGGVCGKCWKSYCICELTPTQEKPCQSQTSASVSSSASSSSSSSDVPHSSKPYQNSLHSSESQSLNSSDENAPADDAWAWEAVDAIPHDSLGITGTLFLKKDVVAALIEARKDGIKRPWRMVGEVTIERNELVEKLDASRSEIATLNAYLKTRELEWAESLANRTNELDAALARVKELEEKLNLHDAEIQANQAKQNAAWAIRVEGERDQLAAENAAIREVLKKVKTELTNLQPHIVQACIPGHEKFIDTYVDVALEEINKIANPIPLVADFINCREGIELLRSLKMEWSFSRRPTMNGPNDYYDVYDLTGYPDAADLRLNDPLAAILAGKEKVVR